MFAIKGWSVPASALKTQTTTTRGIDESHLVGTGLEKKAKKRKRSDGVPKATEVNPENLSRLWETVIEGKKPQKKKKARKSSEEGLIGNETTAERVTTKDDAGSGEVPERTMPSRSERSEKRRADKERKKAKKANVAQNSDHNLEETAHRPHPPPPPPASHSNVSKLTPLQASMRQKLISARFRHLNQTLYTTPSSQSLSLFKESPEMFQEYHEGFRRQVEVWPENPVDTYIQQILQRGAVRGPSRHKGSAPQPDSAPPIPALPRTDGTCTIADLGCGDAALSLGVQPKAKKLHLAVHSFDLQSPNSRVTVADIAHLPLADNSVDVAIFCLALMGTNWVDFIEEAFRILRWKGELWVAEIKSRFGRVGGGGSGGRVEHSVGNPQTSNTPGTSISEKKRAQQEEATVAPAADEADLGVEVDGQEDPKAQTDVAAFVEVLRKRGFLLAGSGGGGDEAIDLRNKMFVKMTFVKGLTPVKGKGVPVPKGMAEMGLETWRKKPKGRFIDKEDEVDVHVSTEAAVLKPCVYKLR